MEVPLCILSSYPPGGLASLVRHLACHGWTGIPCAPFSMLSGLFKPLAVYALPGCTFKQVIASQSPHIHKIVLLATDVSLPHSQCSCSEQHLPAAKHDSDGNGCSGCEQDSSRH